MQLCGTTGIGQEDSCICTARGRERVVGRFLFELPPRMRTPEIGRIPNPSVGSLREGEQAELPLGWVQGRRRGQVKMKKKTNGRNGGMRIGFGE